MRILIVFLLFFTALVAEASVTLPTMSTVPSRTTCTAPCVVFFDATATTSDQTSTPYHNVDYSWNFGDTTAGNWTYGAVPGSKNFAKGPVTAHVFESAGTFTVALTASDGTSPASRGTVTITVTAADSTFSTTNTTCVANGTSPVAGVGGCPAGAAVADSADWNAALTTYGGNGKRVLFKAGDTFTGTASHTVNYAGPAQISSYGTANSGRAIFKYSGPSTFMIAINDQSTFMTIDSIEFDGEDNTTARWLAFAGPWHDLLLLNNYVHNVHGYAQADWAGSGGYGFYVFGNVLNTPESTFLTDVVFASSGSVVAIMGNSLDAGAYGQQVIRLNGIQKFVVSDNSVAGGSSSNDKAQIDLRGPTGVPTQYGFYANNLSSITRNIQNFSFSATNGSSIADVILERNYCRNAGTATPASSNCISLNVSNTTVRNNLIDGNDTTAIRGVNLRGYNACAFTALVIDGADNTKVSMPSSSCRSGLSASFVGSHLNITSNTGGWTAGVYEIVSVGGTNPDQFAILGSSPGTVGSTGGAGQHRTAQSSENVSVYNNTFYTAQASAAYVAVYVEADALTGNVARNNLVYSPTITATVVEDLSTALTASNNTAEGTGAGSVKTNPFLTTPTSTLSTWRIDPASYADAGGTASFPAQNRDFYNCEDKTGDNRIGALVAAANRQCYGVAQ